MAIDLVDYEKKATEAVQAFWGNREKAAQKQVEAGKIDAGARGSVTAGKNMDGFVTLLKDLIVANGLKVETIHRDRKLISLPGFFRPTKLWDILVVHDKRLVAVIELKSQVGSFGNNFNNRAEEAIGSAHDFWTAYREGAFGDQPKPFLGWLMLVEDAPQSRAAVKDSSNHFPIFPEFKNASYLERYNLLGQKLVREQLYSATCIIASPRTAAENGSYSIMHELTGLKNFVVSLAGHIAAEAAR